MADTLKENYLNRFGAIARLYGHEGLVALSKAHFAVVGLGGVGSWAAESLIRTGIGEITLIDMDDVCVTNTNRQLHALDTTIGQQKVTALSERLIDINPDLHVHRVNDFLTKNNMAELITPSHHMVLDATDSVYTKAAAIAYCRARRIPIVTTGSAGGKLDPRQVTSCDLANTVSDPMLAKVRQILYKTYHFARDSHRRFRVEAVYSPEQMVYPKPNGEVCQQKSAMLNGAKLDCAGGFGSATMVTGAFGFVLASRAIETYLKKIKR